MSSRLRSTSSLLLREMRSLLSSTPAATRENPEKLRRSLLRLILIRVCILTLVSGTVAFDISSTGRGADHLHVIFWLIGFIYAVSLVNVLLVHFPTQLRRIGLAQLVLDVILATLAVHFAQSSVSNILYLLVVVSAATLFGKQGAVSIAALSGVCYGFLKTGILGNPSSLPPSTLEIFLVYTSLVAIALISSHVAQRLDSLGVLASEQAQDLSNLTQQQQQLFDNISVGIITLDLEATVTGINRTARAIMGLTDIDIGLGARFDRLLEQHGATNVAGILGQVADENLAHEVTLKDSTGSRDVHLSLLCRELRDVKGVPSGTTVMFNDVSHVRCIEERLNLHDQMTKLLAADVQKLCEMATPDLQMVGESPIMRQVFLLVDRVASSDASVLITGESGTGKEVIAKAIHARGPRRTKPFVAINCGAIPENLLESELFGHKKGAFTGAVADNPGLFRQANAGTLFLDEVGELPPHMQTKLLRVLQERKVRAVGDVHDVAVDVRVLAATNRDLKREIAKGGFREDLYYRLNVVNIPVPPLRERREDIPLLVRYFVGQHCDPDALLPQISSEALQVLMSYPFPGNIRELENLIERALVLGGQAILPEHFPEEIRSCVNRATPPPPPDYRTSTTKIVLLPVDLEEELARIEKEYLIRALDRSGGIKKQAAQLLGLNFRSFRYRLKKYGFTEGISSESDDNE